VARFQVEVTLSMHGYISVEAGDADAAAKRVRELEVPVEFASCRGIGTALLDNFLEVHIDGVAREFAERVAPGDKPVEQ
jgi:hypothetical protein